MKTAKLIAAVLCCAWLTACAAGGGTNPDRNIERAVLTLDSLYKYYAVPGTGLLREHYPFTEDYTAPYPIEPQDVRTPKEFAYLWPFSGTLSAVNALYEATGSQKYLAIIEDSVLPGLEEYHDLKRSPSGYSSYINSAPASGRFYDDNIWLGIEFANLYASTGRSEYLAKAEEIWRFIESGADTVCGGGIYWCEQNKKTKNTCSNAPAAVFALKLYAATGNTAYLDAGRDLYGWVARTLLDPSDGLYMDNICIDGIVDERKYSYNSGQMLQAAALLYQATGEQTYLDDSRKVARALLDRFAPEHSLADGRSYRRIVKGDNIWFSAVMIRGFCELYKIEKDKSYISELLRSLDFTWELNRDRNGLFADIDDDGMGGKWLLNQAAAVEMFARLGGLNINN